MSHYPGRPREFTHPKRRELLDHIGQGATVEEAAQIVGVSLRTVQREARHNEFFDHDLQLAVHAAPVDPHKLMLRAARTHWRAAAWLLERSDPDRFAKRPPNSCRPETLMDVSAWLIETALEATAPEQREAVYRRMHAVADKALNVLMPDQHEARRCLAGALPDRPMPLSDHEFAKTLRVENSQTLRVENAQTLRMVHDRPAPAIGLSSDSAAGLLASETRAQSPAKSPAVLPSSHIQDFRLLDSAEMDADWRYPLLDEEETDAHSAHHKQVVAPVAGRSPTGVAQRQKLVSNPPPSKGGARGGIECPQGSRPSPNLSPQGRGVLKPAREALPENPPVPIGTQVGEDANLCHPRAPQPAAGQASHAPPNEGIMSPKMSAATKSDATERETADVLAVPAVAARRHAGDGITRHKAGDGIAGLKIA